MERNRAQTQALKMIGLTEENEILVRENAVLREENKRTEGNMRVLANELKALQRHFEERDAHDVSWLYVLCSEAV